MRLTIMSVLIIALSGCFAPDYAEGGFRCEKSQLCPGGYVCIQEADSYGCKREDLVQPSLSIDANPKTVSIDGSLTLTVNPKNFVFSADNVGKKPVLGQGHYHIYIDTQDYNDTSKYVGLGTSEVNTIQFGQGEDQVNITPGKHTLVVMLANNNHTEYDPATMATVEITVASATGVDLGGEVSP
jgi:hypothetical protein